MVQKPSPLVVSRPRALRVFSAVVVASCVAYAVSTIPGMRATPGYSHFWEVGLYNLVSSGSALIVVLRAVLVRQGRLAWSLVAGGMVSYAAATAYFSLRLQPMVEMPYPSLSDGLWLSFYPLSIAGVLILAGRRLRRPQAGPRAATPLDGLIAGLTIAATSAAFAFDHIVSTDGARPIAIVTNFAYPIADLVLLCLIVGVMTALGRSAGPEWWLLGAGMISFSVADTWFLLQIAADTYTPGSPVDAAWAVAQTLVAVAAWRGSVATDTAARSGATTVMLPAMSGAACVTVLVAPRFSTVSQVGIWLATASLVVVLLRLVQAVGQASSLAVSREQAHTDELTGLPNRRAFYESLRHAADEMEQRTGPPRTVLLLDLDRFKEVNDSLGHNTGDQLLRQVARRLNEALGQDAQLCRLGGDEFAILVRGDIGVAELVAADLIAALREPFNVGVMNLHVDGSIGLAALDRSVEPGTALARADVAMYSAKAHRSRTHVYTDDVDGNAWDRLATVEALRNAVNDGQLSVDFQPLIELASGRPCALEALVRWQHPTRGRVGPDDFLALAEQTGLMPEVTSAVVTQALDHAVLLRDNGLELPVAINLSASDLLRVDFVDRVQKGLESRLLPSSALTIEITETVLVAEDIQAKATLSLLRTLGVRLAVDDYGTGYSSLAYLHNLPVSELKIDRAFISRVLFDSRTATIVRSTVKLAHDLGLTIVGEGVESQAQADWLRSVGADAAQGWHIAHPMPAAASVAWLLDQSENVLPTSDSERRSRA